MLATGLVADGVVETLDAVDRFYTVRVDAEAACFELAAVFADQHSQDSLPTAGQGSTRVLPGMERAVQLGGEGTPLVAEFAYAELGARMRMSTWSAKNYVADALDVRHRLPLIWARVCSREARVGNARLVAAKTRHLSVEAAAYVDRAMVDYVDGSLPWGRFDTRLDGKVVAADPETAAAREAEMAREQFAKRTRSCEDGTAGFYLRSTIGVIARIEATIGYVADALKAFGDGDDVDTRRVKATVVLCNPTQAVELLAAFTALRSRTLTTALDGQDPEGGVDDEQLSYDDDAPEADAHVMAGEPVDALGRMDAFARRVGFQPTRLPGWLAARVDPSRMNPTGTDPHADLDQPVFEFDWSRLLPSLTLNLHLSVEDLARGTGGVVRWEGEGPVTHQFVHDHLRPLHSYVIQPVIDLAKMAPVDAYEIPDRHRQAVHLRTPADIHPFSSNLSADVDTDHTAPYQHAHSKAEKRWQSRMENYGPMGRFHHRIKTHGRWTLRQPFPGIYLFRDPHGQLYLVDHTGSHKLTAPGTAVGAATAHDPDIELYPTDTVIEVDFTDVG